MKQTIYKDVLIKSKAYKKIMKLIGKCIENGGWVEFDHRDEKVDVTLNWEKQEG